MFKTLQLTFCQERGNMNTFTSTLKELRLLPVSDASRFRVAVQMFKYMNNEAPTCLKNMFQKRYLIHEYNTRNINNRNLAKCHTALAQNSFYYRGVQYFGTH